MKKNLKFPSDDFSYFCSFFIFLIFLFIVLHFLILIRTAMNRDNVIRITDELRLLFAARIGQKLTAGQVRQIVQSANSNNNNGNNNNLPGQQDRFGKRNHCFFFVTSSLYYFVIFSFCHFIILLCDVLIFNCFLSHLFICLLINLFSYSYIRSNGLSSVSLGEVIEAIKEIASEGSSIYTESNQVVFIRA